MLYNMSWLKQGQRFPPSAESIRIDRYKENASLFDGDHFSGSTFRHRNGFDFSTIELYEKCARRISKVIGNFDDVISFPVLLNYQRLMTLKMADLVCGEYPNISTGSDDNNQKINDMRTFTELDSKLYSSVIDISRYGDAILRIYLDETTLERTFTVWDPCEWFPIVAQDGTNRIIKHCLCWKENREPDPAKVANWYLHVQIHNVNEPGYYTDQVWKLDSFANQIIKKVGEDQQIATGIDTCAVMHLKSFAVSNAVYGYDDYMPIDSILAEIMTRIGQISIILDKHANPNLTGPVSMLSTNPTTGEKYLASGSFYATSPGEDAPKYLTWEGQLEPAFKELEFLVNQLYIVSEMGSALIGDSEGGSQVVSGTALRFKMSSPLTKARRISNSLTKSIKQLVSILIPNLKVEDITIKWMDGLPDDPREIIELAKLASGEEKMMSLRHVLIEYLNKSPNEADDIITSLDEQVEKSLDRIEKKVNKPGPQDGTGVNTQTKGSETGLNNFG